MSNKMLIDAAHPEETRVVVLRGNRVEDFDFESASKKPLRGNIYLAKVTRVEPSLQAAFIEYGGNRHGFLAFSEIHPDYYQIPVADRQALLEEEARAHREEDDEPRGGGGERGGSDRGGRSHGGRDGGGRDGGGREGGGRDRDRRSRRRRRGQSSEKRASEGGERITGATEDYETADQPAHDFGPIAEGEFDHGVDAHAETSAAREDAAEPALPFDAPEPAEFSEPETHDVVTAEAEDSAAPAADEPSSEEAPSTEASADHADDEDEAPSSPASGEHAQEAAPAHDEEEPIEQIGGDALDDTPYRAPRTRRNYKIQEVIKRRQILLVQVVKEERGNKGAALTTYLSLAGRYSVLMPNTARGGGISRKITDNDDRRRLKSIAQELDVPEGMGIILRTAGASRSESEVKRDFEYLLRMWETIRETTLNSSAPALVYEEGSLIKRAIRDLYTKEMEEICVAGEAGYREAKDFMRLLMPTHTKNVKLYSETQPIFAKSGAEAQLDAMFSNHVTLRSGGYLVINQTEALVAIDVNSGRSTREHNIEDTALRTNLEAADEVARQLRLRDLAGLVVVDFIDMEEGRNNRAVERRIKDALKNDRARIQIGRISHFGLLEMSRQRIRTGVVEGSTVLCPHCAGAGTVRSTSSIALHVLRVLEDTLIRSTEFNLVVRTRLEVAFYMLNQKRSHINDLEQRYGVMLSVMADPALTGTIYHAIERGDAATPPPMITARTGGSSAEALVEDEEDLDLGVEDDEIEEQGGDEAGENTARGPADGARRETEEEGGERRRRRRRRRRGRDRDGRDPAVGGQDQASSDEEGTAGDETSGDVGAEMEADAAFEAPPTTPALDDADLPFGSEPSPTASAADALAVEPEAEPQPEVVEQPRRRRSRRAATKTVTAETDAEDVPVVAAEEEAAPAPRRSRRARTRAPEAEAPGAFDFQGPSADRDVGAPIAKREDPEPEAPASPPVAASPAEVARTPEPATPPKAVETPEPKPEPEPARPKRSGWWQRAKATLTGE